MNRYVINILATQDLNQIADYFADYNIEAGEKFFREFNQKCKQLVLFPKSRFTVIITIIGFNNREGKLITK